MDGTGPLSVFCEAARRKHFDYLAQLVYSLSSLYPGFGRNRFTPALGIARSVLKF